MTTSPQDSSKTTPAGLTVPCPQCRGPSQLHASNTWRPFCSERCRQIDMGSWAAESYRVEAKPPSSPEEAQDWE